MGQKVNPHGLRVGVIKDWDAKWYAEDDFADNLVEIITLENSSRISYMLQEFQRLKQRELQTD